MPMKSEDKEVNINEVAIALGLYWQKTLLKSWMK